MKKLIFDIETAPIEAHVWGLFNQNVGLSQIRKPTYVLSWAAKWYGSKKVFFDSVWTNTPQGSMEHIHSLFCEADVVVGYNSNKFDIPHLNREWLQLGIKPPTPYKSLDLYQKVRRTFRFPSNKLAYVTQALGLDTKVSHEGHGLWVKVLAGDTKAQNKMKIYNMQDVRILEPLHDLVIPWSNGLPNQKLYLGDDVCPKCGTKDLKRDGYTRLTTGVYQQYRCSNGCWSRSNTRLNGTNGMGVTQ